MTDALDLPTVYDPKSVEPEIRALWDKGNYFHADPADPREPYVIVIPPPNVTGALHGGHALNNTLQDILIRWRRMQGHNTLWMPGVDHAGIATQAVVEKRIFETEKKSRHDLGREELVKRIWAWKEQYGNRIIEQLKLMGCSCDWERTRFTLDEICARAVRETFFKLFKDGLIIRGKRLVNWDTHLQTAVADDEVYHETVKGHFYHFKYPVIEPKPGEPEFVHIATTRPETMLGDTAVAVHPDPEGALNKVDAALRGSLPLATDKERAGIEALLEEIAERRRMALPTLLKLRDMALDGRQVRLPLVCRPIPLITDEWARPELGSGCVKITPAHDPNDYEVGQRHKLAMINVMTPDGRIADLSSHTQKTEVSQKLEGLKFATDGRKAVVAALEERGLVEKIEDRQIELGHSDRSKTPIEPYLSNQWFVRMGDEPPEFMQIIPTDDSDDEEEMYVGLAQRAMDAVCLEEHSTAHERKLCGKVHFFPSRYAKTYLDWLAEKRDWCISRQLWWGHRIPVWSLRDWRLPGTHGRPELAQKMVRWRKEGRIESINWVMQDGSVKPGHICIREPDDQEVVRAFEEAEYVQDPDVLDTWFSSALWPHSTLGWPGQTAELAKYYPGSVLSTAREIITLWVARMVITGLYNLGRVPFHDVNIHAVIQDAQGRPFKKTLGNGFDPVDIIEFYGADALRFTMASCSTETQDIRMPMKKVKTADGRELQSSDRFELGRNFCNKLWNAARFAFITLSGDSQAPPGSEPGAQATGATEPEARIKDPPWRTRGSSVNPANTANPTRADSTQSGLSSILALETKNLPIEDRWILSKTSAAAVDVQAALAGFQFSKAVTLARDFFWDSVCDWYLELVKLRVRENRQANEAKTILAFVLDQSLRLLHPFVPFITERLWQQLEAIKPVRESSNAAGTAPALIIAAYPPTSGWREFNNPQIELTFADLQNATRAVREVRQTQNVAPKQSVDITIKVPAERVASMRAEAHVIRHLANVGAVTIDPGATSPKNSASLSVGDMQIFVHDVIDPAAERDRLEKELANLDKQIASLSGKLNNEGFVKNAKPEVVVTERQRLTDLQAKRSQLLETMSAL